MERSPCSLQTLKGGRSEPSYRSASFLAQELSGFLVDEMKPGAGEADDGHIGTGTSGIGTGLVLRRGRRKPMLYVGAQPWTFEKDMSAHAREYAGLARRVISVWLRSCGLGSWGLGGSEKHPTLLPPGHLGRTQMRPPTGPPYFFWRQILAWTKS
jgi:hypothetical protein